jgi:hypothetical protein
MSEEQFWTRYFRSKFFHDRKTAQRERQTEESKMVDEPTKAGKEEASSSESQSMQIEPSTQHIDAEDFLNLENSETSVSLKFTQSS